MNSDQRPSIQAERLRSARQARGISQADAAAYLGMSRPTFIAIEQGRRAPRPEELLRLAELYGRSVHDLVRETRPVQALAASFRLSSPGDSQDALKVVGELESMADDVLELEEVVGSPTQRNYPPTYDLQRLPVDRAAEQLASAERHRLGLGDGPVPNLRSILEEELGLRIFTYAMPGHIAGLFTVVEPIGGCIALNARHPIERRRWTLAHEYAHFLTDRWTPEVTLSGNASARSERLAEMFAAHFLMPSGGVIRRFQSVRKSREGKFTPADLLQQAAQFQVSVQALALRLEDLGLIASGWWDELQARGLKVRDAQAELGLPQLESDDDVLPARTRYLALEAYKSGDLSEGRFAHLFRTDRVTARQIVNELSASTDIGLQGQNESWVWEAGLDGDEGS